MIRKYTFGNPVTTGAIVQPVTAEAGDLPIFNVTREGDTVRFTLPLAPDDMIFGLGESVGGINKRGHRYRAWAEDNPDQHEGREGLYGAHNFLVFVREGNCFGVYFDDPGEVIFDLGWTALEQAVITSKNGDLDVYIIDGEDTPAAICHAFRGLTGRSYIPPRWAMGYIQSRWGYKDEADVTGILKQHRDRHIPLDAIVMDIDYMDGYRDFTVNKDAFPDLKRFADEMKDQHVRLIPIIDAGIKRDESFDVYQEAISNDLVCKKADGTPFIAAVWPGRCVFPDFLRADVRAWFGNKYHRLLNAGIEGFWNDMNEPALFYSDDSLKAAFAKLDELRTQELDINGFFALKDAVLGIANNQDDYRSFYHEIDGRLVRHDRVHNLYGAHMTQAAADGFRTWDSTKRVLMFSRSSFIGAHRAGGIWQGDNSSHWSHILLNLHELPSLNMCGFIFNGADLGGFGDHTSPDLLARWLQLGVFAPLMRNHACMGTREQEIYRFTNWQQMRDTVTVRYALLPYLYSEMMQAILSDGMMFRPLAFDYPEDRTACHTEDQVMLGRDCMIAPVYEVNATGRHVYLPEDMLMVRFTSATEYELIPVPAGHCWVNLALNQFPLFIRKGHVIPLAAPAEYEASIDSTHLTLLGWVEEDVEVHTDLYMDDGITTDPVLADGLKQIVVVPGVSAVGDGLVLDAGKLIVE